MVFFMWLFKLRVKQYLRKKLFVGLACFVADGVFNQVELKLRKKDFITYNRRCDEPKKRTILKLYKELL